MTEHDVLRFRIQKRILTEHEGSTVKDAQRKNCVVSPFVCMECQQKCEFVKEALKDAC